jgi:hypothetical protein
MEIREGEYRLDYKRVRRPSYAALHPTTTAERTSNTTYLFVIYVVT